MSKVFGGWGAVLICILCLAIGVGGVAVGYKSYVTLQKFDEMINILQNENAELREALSSKSAAPMRQEMTLIVKDKTKNGKNTLAIQNRNYLNIKQLGNGDVWQGQIGVDKYGHVIFKDPAYSIRAGALTLIAYEKRHGVDTVEKLVKRFSENNHSEYISYICKRVGVKKDAKISLRAYLPQLLKAMVAFETGMQIEEYAELVASLQ